MLPVALMISMLPMTRAQQSSNITHYMFMNMSFNPAFAGSSDGISITGLVRQQWFGFKDDHGGNPAPQSLFLSIDSPIRFLHGGIGGNIINDKLAQFNNTQLMLAYSYRTDIGPGELFAGLQLNLLNSQVSIDKFEPIVSISNVGKNDFIVDGSLGLYYKVPEKYYVGFSCSNFLQSRMKKTMSRDKRVYDLTGGYNWVVPGYPAFELQPSAFITTDLADYSFSVSALLQYNKKYWGGIAYRFQDAASILVGFTILKSIRVGISYDATVSKLTRYSNGCVEVFVNYIFKIETEKFRKSYKNTRFL